MNFSIQNTSTMKIKMKMPPRGWPAFGWEALFKWKASMWLMIVVFFALASCQKSELLIPNNIQNEIQALQQDDDSQRNTGNFNKEGNDEDGDDDRGDPSGNEGEEDDGDEGDEGTGDGDGDDDGGVTDKDGCDCDDDDEGGEVTDKNGDDDETEEDSGGD